MNLVIKRNEFGNKKEILMYDSTWVVYENIMLNDRSPSQKITTYVIPFIRSVQNRLIYRDRK